MSIDQIALASKQRVVSANDEPEEAPVDLASYPDCLLPTSQWIQSVGGGSRKFSRGGPKNPMLRFLKPATFVLANANCNFLLGPLAFG